MKAVLAMVVVMLAGCASGGHCVGEFEYQKALNLPSPQPVEGLKPMDTSSALRIPPEPAQKTPYAETYPDPEDPEEQKVRCLDVPPRLEEPAPAPAPADVPKKS